MRLQALLDSLIARYPFEVRVPRHEEARGFPYLRPERFAKLVSFKFARVPSAKYVRWLFKREEDALFFYETFCAHAYGQREG